MTAQTRIPTRRPLPEQIARYPYRGEVPARARAAVTEEPPASRHTAGHYTGLHPEDMPRTTINRATGTRNTFVRPQAADEDDVYPRRARTSARRYIQVHHPQALVPVRQSARRTHWLAYAGLVVIVMLIGWLLVTLVSAWWTNVHNDWQYGNPRTVQYDVAVGHNNDSPAHPSHFIALNLHGNVEVIEQAGGDAGHTHIYTIPMSFDSGDPVTVAFKDINGDGKVDMVVHVENTDFPFINDSGQFRPVKPGEHVNV